MTGRIGTTASRSAMRRMMIALAPGLALLAAACSTGSDTQIAPRGMSCVDDSQTCVAERGSALNALMADKQRAWVRQPAPAASYASGVRLFAFKQRRKELSCDELAIGRKEADAAPGTLRGPQGQGLTPAQVSRGVMLAAEVGKELANEAGRRCRV